MFLSKIKMVVAVLFIFGMLTVGIGEISPGRQAATGAENRNAPSPEKEETPNDAELRQVLADLDSARAELEKLNAVVDAARKRFLAARERYVAARQKGTPAEPKKLSGLLVKADLPLNSVHVEFVKVAHEPDHELLGTPNSGFVARVFESFSLSMDAAIVQDNVPAKLADLKTGSHVALRFDRDGKTVVGIAADGGTTKGRFVSANPARNTIVVARGEKKIERKTYHLVKETEVLTESGKAARIADLAAGAALVLTLSVEDANTVVRIRTFSKLKGGSNAPRETDIEDFQAPPREAPPPRRQTVGPMMPPVGTNQRKPPPRNTFTNVPTLKTRRRGALGVGPSSVPSELKRFAGTWKVASFAVNGRELPKADRSENPSRLTRTWLRQPQVGSGWTA